MININDWVNSFNRIPTSIIDKLWMANEEDVMEVTPMSDEEYEHLDSLLPMWGWMWYFDDSLDEDWLVENMGAVKECGFRIYYVEDIGYVFGIDGAGYDFYESHWQPLYELRFKRSAA